MFFIQSEIWGAECDQTTLADVQEKLVCLWKAVSNHRSTKISCAESTLPVDGVAKGTNPDQLSPAHYGWMEVNGLWSPMITDLPPSPKTIVKLVQCECGVSRCSGGICCARDKSLSCTEMCKCDADADKSDNILYPLDTVDVAYPETAEEV